MQKYWKEKCENWKVILITVKLLVHTHKYIRICYIFVYVKFKLELWLGQQLELWLSFWLCLWFWLLSWLWLSLCWCEGVTAWLWLGMGLWQW